MRVPNTTLEGQEREAAGVLAEALAQVHALHLPGARALHRERLERALTLTRGLLDEATVDEATLARATRTAALAHAARARDARHGAGQLSQSAQRAPTVEDCELGWRNVESIVDNAEASARAAARLAAQLGDREVEDAAQQAAAAAAEARRIIDARNHAYTFHADPSFSFGEGWYVAAAAVLAGVSVQVEQGQAHTEHAERFLRDARLGARVVPYRSRPRANKALPDLIARAFAEDPGAAQARLRAAFLGGAERASVAAATSPEIVDWADVAFADVARSDAKVLVWVRDGSHQPARNSTRAELRALCRVANRAGLTPVLVGDALRQAQPPRAIDLTLFWRQPLFQGLDMRRAQLQLFEHLRGAHRLVGQVGVTTAGMDGPALMGLPTIYLTGAPNPRIGRWVGSVPGYEEVVRGDGYLDHVERTLTRWTAPR